MSVFNRVLEKEIATKLKGDKAIIILGARQVGKTTLLDQLFASKNTLWLNGDDADTRDLLAQPNVAQLKRIIGKAKYVVIDEAQRIPNIGVAIKIITDRIKTARVIATGSSSFELRNHINEPLTGRKWEFQMFPLSFYEMVQHHGLLEEKRSIPHRMVYGYYPEIVSDDDHAEVLIKSIADSYLYKDVLMLDKVQKPEKLERLVQALALQIGSEVSYNELAQLCQLDKETIERYIQLLEKAFVIFRLNAFNRNVRNELTKSRKIYFYDNGIRNAVLSRFETITRRDDVGALWENFVISERMKKLRYENWNIRSYFWRTTAQQEVDYVEEYRGKIYAWELKWNKHKKVKFPLTFTKAYQPVVSEVVSPQNVDEFLL